MKELSKVSSSYDSMTINPDLIVLKAPVEISLTRNSINIKNLWTFFSFKRLSKRLIANIRRQSEVLTRQFLSAMGYRDINIEVGLRIHDKTSELVIKFEDQILDRDFATNLIKHMFSLTCFEIPEYSIREYKLVPISEDKLNFFVVLVPYKRSFLKMFDALSNLLKYPYVTLPNEQGEYYSSELGEDNINEPPKILSTLLNSVNIRGPFNVGSQTPITALQEVIFAPEVESLKPLRPSNRALDHIETVLTQAIKDIASIIDRFENPKPVYELLQLLHRTLNCEKLTKDDAITAINILEEIAEPAIELSGLKGLLDYFRGIYNEFLLAEKLEDISIMRAILRRIERTICRSGKFRIDSRGIPLLCHAFIITGSIVGKLHKKLINLGSGKAIYLNSDEWRCISEEFGVPENVKVEVKIVKRLDGRKCLIVDFITK
ncbi:MAG: hypothetical protein QXY55_03365 [Candidatus Korarchaeota archaeon]|nr:hypothetical protein [Thermoproteota archaeon]